MDWKSASVSRRTFGAMMMAAPAVLSGSALAQQAAPQSLKIMFGIDNFYAAFIAAMQKGFFEKQRINAEYRMWEDGNVALDSILTGDSDIGATSELGILVRAARSDKLFVVGRSVVAKGLVGAVTRVPFNTPKDMEGKKVGIVPAGAGHYFYGQYVKKYGLDESKIRLVRLSIADSVAALHRGDVDIAFIWQPWISKILQELPSAKVLAWTNTDNIYNVTHYIVFSERLVVRDPELGKRALRAIVDGSTWLRDNSAEGAELAAKVFKMTPQVARDQIVNNFEWGKVSFGPEIRPNFEEGIQFLKDNKVLQNPPDLNRLLRPDLLKAVAPDLVTAT